VTQPTRAFTPAVLRGTEPDADEYDRPPRGDERVPHEPGEPDAQVTTVGPDGFGDEGETTNDRGSPE
jgi:hypothetical protein